ncbi:MAG: iron ABC transporter permease [Candidatus Omnitrophica bacterium]|nr:iron ABC transporter permease [Candidatus Omnitrophota bacterium]
MKTKIIKALALCFILLVIVIMVAVFSLSVGASKIALKDILSGNASPSAMSIIYQIRLPRIVLGFAVGSALALAGVILQGMFRNPLVEPYTLGISGGAALGVALGIALKLNRFFRGSVLSLAGFAGAAVVVILVYFLSRKRGIIRMQGFLLLGVMLSYICASMMMLIMALVRAEDLQGIIFWTMGSLEQPNLFLIKLMLSVSVAGLVFSYYFCRELNAFSLGQEQAQYLGINTEKVKNNLFFLASLLTGMSVSVSGIIGFVGLVIPHCVRFITGADHKKLLISSYFIGGAFLIFCDTLARTLITPLELPVGVITGVAGGCFFIFILLKKTG